MAARALDAVKSREITLVPPRYEVVWEQWLDPGSIKDWCISRQLWWGHRIPVYYIRSSDKQRYVIAANMEEAVSLAIEKYPEYSPEIREYGLVQEEDVLDTWFR